MPCTFDFSAFPGGANPSGESGGAPTFAWSAPNGLADGNSIIVTSTTQSFTVPEKHIFLGFGMGWMYDSPLDTAMPATLDVNGETLLIDNYNDHSAERVIKESGGIRYLESFCQESAQPDNNSRKWGAKMINLPLGREITNADHVHMFSRSMASVATGSGGVLQWKQDRIKRGRSLDAASKNYVYVTTTDQVEDATVDVWQRLDARYGDDSSKGFECKAPIHDGQWTTFGWSSRPNTVDLANGVNRTMHSKAGDTNFAAIEPTHSDTSTLVDYIMSASPDRPDYIMRQDYFGNTTSMFDITVRYTDAYWVLNGDIFLLADSADLSTCVEQPIPLVPTTFSGAGNWTFNLWKGLMSSYAGKYIHRLNSTLQTQQVVSLGGV